VPFDFCLYHLGWRQSRFRHCRPPKTKVVPVEDSIQGRTIVDNYRWLEDSKSPETQAWVGQELTYTRSMLDVLAGREKIEKRLETAPDHRQHRA